MARPVSILGGASSARLLARLLLDANRTVSAERLIDDLWGDDVPDTAPKMVQIHVSQLRKAAAGGRAPDAAAGLRARAPTPRRSTSPASSACAAEGGRRWTPATPRTRADAARARRSRSGAGPPLAEFASRSRVHEAARLEELRLACARGAHRRRPRARAPRRPRRRARGAGRRATRCASACARS